MKLFTVLLLTSAPVILGFTPSAFTPRSSSSYKTTRRSTPSSTTDAPPSPPTVPILPFSEIGPVVGVVGLGNSRDRSDSFAFEGLHDKDHPVFASQFTKIVAFVDDAAFSKKRLIGRTARYSGLSDILEFRDGGLSDKVNDVDCLLVFATSETDVDELISTCASSSPPLKSLSILLSDSPSATTLSTLSTKLASSSIPHTTLLATGELIAGAKEGNTPYRISEFSSSSSPSSINPFPLDEAVRIATESVTLPCAHSKTLCVTPASDEKAASYLRLKRSSGLTRGQEIGDLILGGMEKYEANVLAEEEKKANAEKEEEKEKATVMVGREEEIAALIAKGRQEAKEYEQKKVLDEGKEFLAREWREQFFGKKTSATEEEYIEQNMERGLKEGTRIVNMMRGTDYEGKDDHMRLDLLADENDSNDDDDNNDDDNNDDDKKE